MSMGNWLSIGTHSQLKYWPSKLGSRRLGKASNRSAVSGMWFGEEIQGGSPELLIGQTQKRREQVPPEQLLRVTLSTLTQLSTFLQYCETKVLPNSMREPLESTRQLLQTRCGGCLSSTPALCAMAAVPTATDSTRDF